MRLDMQRAVGAGCAVALAVLLSTMALLAAPGGTAQAQIDISGDWILNVEGGYSDSCSSAVQQTDTQLASQIDCSIGSGDFSGTIDPSTGSFMLAGNLGPIGVNIQGIASQDGQSISGTWDASGFELSGTFSGTRGVFPPAPTPGDPGSLSGPLQLDSGAGLELADTVGLPDTGSGPSGSGGDSSAVLIAGVGVLVTACGAAAMRLTGRRRRVGP